MATRCYFYIPTTIQSQPWRYFCHSSYLTIAATVLYYSFQLQDNRSHNAIFVIYNYHAIAVIVLFLSATRRSRPRCYLFLFQLPCNGGHSATFIFFHLPYHCEHWSLSFISPSNYHTIVVLTTIRCGHSDISLFLSPTTMRSHLRSLPLSIHYHTITVRAFFKLNRILKSHTFTFSS